MTTMVDRFFGLQQHVIRSGLFSRLKEGEIRLYVGLMYESERCSTRKLTLTDAQILKMVGVASRTACNARKRLQEFGLIKYELIPGEGYVYTICDSQTQEPYPGNPRQRIQYQKQSKGTPKRTTLAEPPHLVEPPNPGSSQSSLATEKRVKNKNGTTPLNEHGLPGVFDTPSGEPSF